MANKYWVQGTGSWNQTTHWSLTSGGASGAAIPQIGDNVYFDGASGGGTVTVTATVNTLNLLSFSGGATGTTGNFGGIFTNNLSNFPITITGTGMTLSPTMTMSYTSGINFTSTSAGNSIKCNGNTFPGNIIINGPGGSFLLDGTFKTTATFTVTAGTVTSNADVYVGVFASSVTNTRSITVTNFYLTGLSFSINTGTGLTLSITNLYVTDATASAKTIALATSVSGITNTYIQGVGTGSYTLSNQLGNLNIQNTGSATVDIQSGSSNSAAFTSINFTGSTVTWNSTAGQISILGNLTLAATVTVTASSNLFFLGTGTIDTAGKTLTGDVTVNSSGTVTMSNLITTGLIVLTLGTLSLTNNITSAGFTANTSNSRVINFNNSNWTITGASATTMWNVGNSTAFTTNIGTATIRFTNSSATAVTFTGGTLSYPTVWFDRGASVGAISIAGGSTFYIFKDTGTVAHSLIFTSGTTTTFNDFIVNGSSGNLITITKSSAASATFVKSTPGIVNCNYLSINGNTATPNFTWYAGYFSVNGGSVSGWIFSGPPRMLSLGVGY